MPLLLRCLDLSDTLLRASVIETIDSATRDTSSDLLPEYASTLVSTTLKLCQDTVGADEQSNTATVNHFVEFICGLLITFRERAWLRSGIWGVFRHW